MNHFELKIDLRLIFRGRTQMSVHEIFMCFRFSCDRKQVFSAALNSSATGSYDDKCGQHFIEHKKKMRLIRDV